ncbi:unnamed protein product [Microthlaspi erraticum]|uniref:Uncharacterized protein n=1 Tax=Microthlaspi erraticum TaxID=1685480 RepID=A0A6D2JL56_9BRAS|nr:unnamed protein product [Microthlaspi erraticum]
MASSGSADEDFQSRVARIFGSLAFPRSSSSSLSTASAPAPRQQSGSVWSISDKEVEKREWKREQLASYDRDEMPCASSFNELLQQRMSSTARKPLEGEDDVDEVANEDFDDEWGIRASMGLDRTLDDEEEEDEFDKVALGEECGGEGLPTKDALSESSGGRVRDPRANHIAAKIRLKEDEIEASKISASKSKAPHSEESSKAVPPKPILKRKENSSDSEAATRTSKRVRFDVETSKKPEDTCSASASVKIVLQQQGKSGARVPDYLVNPSKYTCYSFDPSSESKEKSPTLEDMDIPKAVEGLETSESESFKKVSFIPQKKTKDDVREDSSNCSETKPIAAALVAEDEIASATGDEDTEIGEESDSCTSIKIKGRQYRAKRSLEETDV